MLRPQAEAARLGLPALERAAGSVPLPKGPLRLADLGCATGENSVEPVRRVVAAWRQRSPQPIEVCHVDLPHADFGRVLEHAQEYATPGVRSAVLAGSFYEPLFPPDSLHLVWSATATHWLSRVPGPRPTPRSTLSRRPWVEQARADWERWLACRARELAPGGQIVMVGSGADRFGGILAEGLLEMVAECAPGLNVPTYHRRLDEWTAPLDGPLRLLEASEPQMADPYWDDLSATGDRETYADRVVEFVRDSLSLVGLPSDFVPELRRRVLDRPEQARCRWWVTVLRLERVA